MKAQVLQTRQHQLLDGDTLEYYGAPEVLEFVERVRKASEDASVPERALTELIWGLENPLLDTTVVPGKAYATRATYEHPAWDVLMDLESRKRIQVGTLDLDRAHSKYTLTVAEAAERLGMHESAVRQAIQARKLAAIKRNGQHFLDPKSVQAYRKGNRGPKAGGNPLFVQCGSMPGVTFQVKQALWGKNNLKIVRDGLGARTRFDTPAGWKRIAVLTGKKDENSYRYFLLEPADKFQELAFEGFFVRGQFKVAERVNNSREAQDAFKRFQGT
jgi:excisionase family DNA binding protein